MRHLARYGTEGRIVDGRIGEGLFVEEVADIRSQRRRQPPCPTVDRPALSSDLGRLFPTTR
jgi:hypothetical protein